MSFFRRLKLPPVPAILARGKPFIPADSGKDIEDYLRKLRDALAAWDPDASPVIVGASVDGALTLGDSGTIASTQEGDGVTLEVVDDSITDAKLRDATGFSVIGRAATGTGETADIVAGTDAVLGRDGSGDLGFAPVATGQIADEAVTFAKLQTILGPQFLGNSDTGFGLPVTTITPTQARTLLNLFVVLRPAQITADQNDYIPGNFSVLLSVIFASTDASRNITGIQQSTTDGVVLIWINNGTQDTVLQHENASSTASSRLICPAAGDFTLGGAEAVVIVRDETADRWRVFSL